MKHAYQLHLSDKLQYHQQYKNKSVNNDRKSSHGLIVRLNIYSSSRRQCPCVYCLVTPHWRTATSGQWAIRPAGQPENEFKPFKRFPLEHPKNILVFQFADFSPF
jgi:hypothetical protein